VSGGNKTATRQGRVFLATTVLTFAIGCVAGIATIQMLPGPEPASRLSQPQLEAFASGARLGVDRALASAAPAAVEAAFSGVGASGRRRLEAGSMAFAAARRGSGALTSRARVAEEAHLDKVAIARTPHAIEEVLVERGDTLMDILIRAGIASDEAHAAVASLRAVYDPRRLRAGQELTIAAANGVAAGSTRHLAGLSFEVDFDHAIEVTRAPDGAFESAKVARPQQRRLVYRGGRIDSSLYLAAERVAMPHDVLHRLIKLFSWDVDFQRDLHPGDRFESLYEQVSLAGDERAVRGGDLLYARLSLRGVELEAYRFERPDGTVEYFDPSGKSLRKFLLRTPVDGARMSSGFGMRRHPILGYSRMHRGVDFAAPTGTPIFAAGGGRIEVAGRKGGYGKYVRIRHNGEYGTAYAHLSRIAKGIAPGARVEQGQVIGYVGTTGRSTGPHLHYEVHKHGEAINPMKLEQPPTARLEGDELARFQDEMARIDRLRRDHANGTLVAGSMNAPGG